MRETWHSIDDYAIIGNCRSAALVSRTGSIDWLCWPRFDSPSVFGRLLDPEGGSWSIAPTVPYRSTRRYLPETNVLETTFHCPGGSVRLLDFMPLQGARLDDSAVPEQEIVRILVCDRGEVPVTLRYVPRPHYGMKRFRLRERGRLGVRTEAGAELFLLESEFGLKVAPDGVSGCATLRAGERLRSTLVHASQWPAVFSPLTQAEQKLDQTVSGWRAWTLRLRFHGPERDWVVRSALVLRLLVFAPSGAVVGAPTTSLPERVGADLNWDYRYCWLRDASMTVRALFGIGCGAEADSFVSWLLHATRLTRPELRVLYDVFGNLPRGERERTGWSGYRESRPVRLGNAADNQLQLDVYGEVIDAATHFIAHGGEFDPETERMLRAFGEYVCRNWEQPDEGIWEPRGERRRNTHSLVLCWAALDRLLKLARGGNLHRAPLERFAMNREMIREVIESRAWNEQKRSYVATLDGDGMDAALLLMPWYGYIAPDHPRMQSTWQFLRRELGAGGSLLYRYRLPPGSREGAFGICSFWAAEYLAAGGGSLDEAQRWFDAVLPHANDLGLFGEEIDPTTGRVLGNFPQAFTHLGLISAALRLAERRGVETGAADETRRRA